MKLQTLSDFERQLGRTKDKQFLVSPDHIRKLAFEWRDELKKCDELGNRTYLSMIEEEEFHQLYDKFDKLGLFTEDHKEQFSILLKWINNFFKEYEEIK